ncbi:putative cytochrome P450 4ac2 isoform 3-T9 [Glossina fuscipes fuscipes]
MYDFLGDGLLRTSEEKWHLRRKLLTPAFHFNMLQTFNEIFKEESLKLLEKLKHLQHKDINIGDVIDEFSLNNVCETALGVELNDIDGATRYRAAIHNIEPIIRRRLCNSLRNSYVKTRYAMLDTLLHHEAQGLVDQQGICEEVATFMLEGFDTTSTCLKFALLNIVY